MYKQTKPLGFNNDWYTSFDKILPLPFPTSFEEEFLYNILKAASNF